MFFYADIDECESGNNCERMHNALTQGEVSLAHATLATLETAGLNAQVEIDCCS